MILFCILGYCCYQVYNLKVNESHSEELTEEENLPKEDDPYENETSLSSNFVSEEDAKEVDLKYDQYITANGYTGASDNVYYTRNGTLYHFVISSERTTKLAEGVDKIESDIDCMKAYKGKDFKLIAEDDYVIYVD